MVRVKVKVRGPIYSPIVGCNYAMSVSSVDSRFSAISHTEADLQLIDKFESNVYKFQPGLEKILT